MAWLCPYTGVEVTDRVILDIHSHGYKQVMYVGNLSVSLNSQKGRGEEKEIFMLTNLKCLLITGVISHMHRNTSWTHCFFFSFWEETGPKSMSDLPYYLWLSKAFTVSLSSFFRLHSRSVWLSKASESSWWWRTILWNGAVFKRTKKRKCHGEGGKEEESLTKEQHALGRKSL